MHCNSNQPEPGIDHIVLDSIFSWKSVIQQIPMDEIEQRKVEKEFRAHAIRHVSVFQESKKLFLFHNTETLVAPLDKTQQDFPNLRL